jgi:hypothetical protein
MTFAEKKSGMVGHRFPILLYHVKSSTQFTDDCSSQGLLWTAKVLKNGSNLDGS